MFCHSHQELFEEETWEKVKSIDGISRGLAKLFLQLLKKQLCFRVQRVHRVQ